MTDADLTKLIQQIVRQEISQMIMGEIVSNESTSRATIQRYPNEAPRKNIRSVQPFGFASKAPAGTPALITPICNDRTNQAIIGNFDEKRPPLNDGDVAIYDAHGHVLYLSNGKIQLGTEGSSENLVLGQVFKTFAKSLLQSLAQETHTGNLGYPTSVPTNAADYTALKSSPIEDNAILSNVSFTEKGS